MSPIDLGQAATGGAQQDARTITGATIGEILRADPITLQTRYLVAPWLVESGINALAARSGIGKTKLIQDFCIARASGGAWLGLPVAPGPALFWSAEQGRNEDFRVTQALCRGRGLRTPEQFPHFFEIIYDPTVRFSHPAMAAAVRERLEAYPGLFIGIDSQRRAFEGDESDSAAADDFFRTVLVPLRAAGATVLTLCHPPKTTGQQKVIADENMIRGSGDWLAQLDSFLILRPVDRHRPDRATETISLRLSHHKARSGPQADPLLITFSITQDLTPDVTFTLHGTTAPSGPEGVEVAGATKAAAALFEEKKRLSRTAVLEHLRTQDFGRPAGDGALTRLLDLGVIRGPLAKEDRHKGERGHWFLFVQPLPPPEMPVDDADEPLEAPDEA